jgi:hypothetical protein
MRNNMPWALCLNILLCGALGGCATILRGTHEKMDFSTNPSGASVAIGGNTYQTPAVVDLKRKAVYPVIITMPGYRTIHFDLVSEWDGVSLVANLIVPGGSAGMIYDRLNGSDHSFHKLARINLEPSTRPDEPPVLLRPFEGLLMDNVQYAQAVEFERKDHARFFRGEP